MSLSIFSFNAPQKLLPQGPNPTAVQAYLRDVLITKLDATPELAEETAAKLGLRSSCELFYGSVEKFTKIFGPDIGPSLFRSVSADAWTDWVNLYPGKFNLGVLGLCFSTAIWMLCRIP
ncbi:hypothetical protein BX600DRAFT_469380 [Xylariales sp. PMI_506]|nr:hypothetical protein BX600DRAFT_469380 [Xylariales sp. PMI_506]